ncbi:SDR family oxidoreductase, partial [Streptomyces olivaceus]|uniref:SDR family oxidoreductase n=1 Tax=Streptomyces olivaceus TaxID=47716 RepID=UPI00365D080C
MTHHSKTVLITGASSGIGEATALRLAADGHRVFLGARRTERLEKLAGRIAAEGGTADFRRLDVTDAADVRAFVTAAAELWGRVDVMVNNAGVMPLSPLAALKVDEWDRMIDVNVRGVLYGIAAVLPVMGRQGGGHVVNVAPGGAPLGVAHPAGFSPTKFTLRAHAEG